MVFIINAHLVSLVMCMCKTWLSLKRKYSQYGIQPIMETCRSFLSSQLCFSPLLPLLINYNILDLDFQLGKYRIIISLYSYSLQTVPYMVSWLCRFSYFRAVSLFCYFSQLQLFYFSSIQHLCVLRPLQKNQSEDYFSYIFPPVCKAITSSFFAFCIYICFFKDM